MRHETLLKVIIITFAIILIILATFVYGNIQRAKQKDAGSTTQTNTEQVKDSNSANDQPTESTQPTAPATNPSPSTAPAPPPTKNSNIPATGASDGVVPMTILSVLGYLFVRSKTNKQKI